jgi:hypothetical protein
MPLNPLFIRPEGIYPLFGLVPWLAFLERQLNFPLLFFLLIIKPPFYVKR